LADDPAGDVVPFDPKWLFQLDRSGCFSFPSDDARVSVSVAVFVVALQFFFLMSRLEACNAWHCFF
jgi:hypothetical protein